MIDSREPGSIPVCSVMVFNDAISPSILEELEVSFSVINFVPPYFVECVESNDHRNFMSQV